MFTPKSEYTRIAYETLEYYLNNGNINKLRILDIPEEIINQNTACFVSLHEADGALRGCIGTIEPRESNLFDEIKRNTVSSAIHDSRFKPVALSEFSGIEISIDVLTLPARISNLDELDPEIFGVIVSDGNYKRAVLLPSIPEIDTIEKQIKIVKRKAGLDHLNNESLEFYRFSSNRYY